MVRGSNPFEISLKYSCMMSIVPQKGGKIASLPWCLEKEAKRRDWNSRAGLEGLSSNMEAKESFQETSWCGSALDIREQPGATIPQKNPIASCWYLVALPSSSSSPSAWLLRSTGPLSLPGIRWKQDWHSISFPQSCFSSECAWSTVDI